MKVIKAIVDELPKSCWECPRFDFDFKGLFKKEHPYCLITGADILIDYKNARPDWCPLITEAHNFYGVSTKIWDNAYRVIKSENK